MNQHIAGAERAAEAALCYKMRLTEIALLEAPAMDADHNPALLGRHGMRDVRVLGLPERAGARVKFGATVSHLGGAIGMAHAMGATALPDVTYGDISERT